MTAFWNKTRRFLVHTILHADDTPHRIALGVAVGIFIGFSPTIGLQMVLALALAALLGANRLVCIPMVWITNPVTLGPIYWACWRVGSALLPSNGVGDGSAVVQRVETMYQTVGLTTVVREDFWRQLLGRFIDVGTELWVGCFVVGIVASFIAYFAARWLVVLARKRRRLLRMAIRLRRERRRRRPIGSRQKVPGT